MPFFIQQNKLKRFFLLCLMPYPDWSKEGLITKINVFIIFLSGKMNLGALDATQHQSVGQEYGVQGYPTIKYFAPGSSGTVYLYILH